MASRSGRLSAPARHDDPQPGGRQEVAQDWASPVVNPGNHGGLGLEEGWFEVLQFFWERDPEGSAALFEEVPWMAAVQRLRERYGADLSPIEAHRALRADPEGGVLDLGSQLWALEPEEEVEEIDELVRLEDELVG